MSCDFCQAPPRGKDFSYSKIISALELLRNAGVKRIKITGGEPLVRKDIIGIMMACNDLQLDVTLCSNGMLLNKDIIECLTEIRAKIKVSVNGPKKIHNSLVGKDVYDAVLKNIQSCIDSGIFLSIHTLITKLNFDVLIPMLEICEKLNIPKISFIPFVPRGRGVVTEGKYALSEFQLLQLQNKILDMRKKYYPQIDVRYIDLWTKEYFTLETNGSLIYSKERESQDIFIEQLV